MRRFGWQIGGLSVALLAVLGLGMLAFGCGSPQAPAHVRASATVGPRVTATADPRVVQVEDAARRYVQALQDAAKSGDPGGVDALVVPGSEAEGNAGIASSFSRDNHYAFIAARIDYGAWQVTVDSTTANVTLHYTLYGHTADWPSLRPREADRTMNPVTLKLELEFHGSAWLVSRSS
jgi:hypothetical protein